MKWLDAIAEWLRFGRDVPDAPPVDVHKTPVTVPACPYPLSTDDGSVADCKAKHHCGCEQ